MELGPAGPSQPSQHPTRPAPEIEHGPALLHARVQEHQDRPDSQRGREPAVLEPVGGPAASDDLAEERWRQIGREPVAEARMRAQLALKLLLKLDGH